MLQGNAWKEVPWWEVLIKTFSQSIINFAGVPDPGKLVCVAK